MSDIALPIFDVLDFIIHTVWFMMLAVGLVAALGRLEDAITRERRRAQDATDPHNW